MNKHVFKGHKTLLGSKYVTYGEVELPLRFDIYPKARSGFDWGHNGPSSMQLAFSILYQLSDKETATKHVIKFTQEVIKKLTSRDWILSSIEVVDWLKENVEPVQEIKPKIVVEPRSGMVLVTKPKKQSRPRKNNVVKEICRELSITQKQLAEILEVPEGTVSSWAVKNEIPRLGKKAIEFYTTSVKDRKSVV